MKHGDGNMTDLSYRVIPDLYAGIEPNVGAANIRLGLSFDYFIRKIDYINVEKNDVAGLFFCLNASTSCSITGLSCK